MTGVFIKVILDMSGAEISNFSYNLTIMNKFPINIILFLECIRSRLNQKYIISVIWWLLRNNGRKFSFINYQWYIGDTTIKYSFTGKQLPRRKPPFNFCFVFVRIRILQFYANCRYYWMEKQTKQNSLF